jgi:hypothetical protein
VAANPIPYWVVGNVVNKSREVFEQAFIDLSGIGFTAVKTDVPSGIATAVYKAPMARRVEGRSRLTAVELSLGRVLRDCVQTVRCAAAISTRFIR